ncbi:MAG: thioredoxin-like domain-containing protein, partial [Bacteroidota bacterium]
NQYLKIEVMKNLLFVLLFMGFVGAVSAQTIIENPKYGMSPTNYLRLTKIELTREATILSFTVKIPMGGWVAVHQKSYIQPVGDTTKLYVIKAEGVDMTKMINWQEGKDKISYRLFFPRLDPKVSKIDFGEPVENAWQIFDIAVREKVIHSVIPNQLLGNWFSPENGNWAFSFFDSLAVYDNNVWKYESVKPINDLLEIILTKNGQETRILVKSDGKSICQSGPSENELNRFTKDVSILKNFKYTDSKAFEAPVLQPGKVIYSGFIHGFTTRLATKTGLISFYDQLTNLQKSYIVKIADDGSFHVEFPLDYPQNISVKLPSGTESVFFEPGKDLFQLINSWIPEYPSLFSGESAEVNFGLRETETINSNMGSITDGITEMNQDEYVDHVLALKKEKQDILNKFKTDHSVSAKVFQIQNLNIEYWAARNIITFNQNLRMANFYANRSLKAEEQKPFIPREIDINLLRKIKDTPINNGCAFISSEYFYLLQALKYVDINRPQGSSFYLISALTSQLEKGKVEFTEEEKAMLAFVKTYLSNKYDDVMEKKFYNDYGMTMQKFQQKYMTELSKIADTYYQENLNSNLQQIFGSSKGLPADINLLQNYLKKINDSSGVLSEEDFKKVKSEISTDYLNEYAISEFYQKKAKLEMNSSSNTTKVKTEGDEIFDSIIKKFRGKVIYVDFWATWCAPCRDGIERIKPLKAELANKNIVFVYITNPTSPEKTYEEMIPKIKGEHFRVSQDEWNFLVQKFNIYGIPHYALVDKNGKIVNGDLMHLDYDDLKNLLVEQINK